MSFTILLSILLFLQSNFSDTPNLTLRIVFLQINSQCAENIYTNQNFATCSPNHQLDSSMDAFPTFLRTNSYTKLSVEIIFNPVSSCNGLASARDLFIMTVQDSLGQEMKATNFAWISGTSYQIYTSLGASQHTISMTSPTPFAVNNDLEVVASIDFDQKVWNVGVNVPGLYSYSDVNTPVSFYSSAFKFDAKTKFYFCSPLPSASTGANFVCNIRTLNLWYTFADGRNGLQYFGALSPVYVAYYRMDEGFGSSIKDSTGTLTSGSFGNNPGPRWPSSKVGAEFTAMSDYIELPGFPTTASGNPFTTHSFTINFWFKFKSTSGTAPIFRYATSALDHYNFGLLIQSSGTLVISMLDEQSSGTSSSAVLPSVWTLITASFSTPSSSSVYTKMVLHQDQKLSFFGFASASTLSNLVSGPFRVIIGGSNSFLGTIAHLLILSPAYNYIRDLTACSSSSSTPISLQCVLNLGMSDPRTCISYPCASSNCDQYSGGTYDTCLSCSTAYEYSNSLSICDVSLIPSVIPVIEPAQTTTSALSKMYSALTKSSSGFSAAVAGKIFSNIKYLDIGYSLELQEALKYWQSSFISMGLDLDPPQGLQDNIPELGVPPTFEKYDVSSDFLINFWEGIVVLLIMVGLFAVLRTLEYLSKESKPKTLLYIKKARYMFQNLLYSQLYGVFGDVVMYSVLNYRTQKLGEGLSSLGFIISVLLSIITASVIALGFDLLVQYQRLKTNKRELEELLQENQGNSITFEDFKDTSLLQQAFLFLLILRDVLFSFILTLLFQHPLAQTILILLLNLSIIAILFINKPFKERFDFLQQIFYEVVTLAVNFAIIILAAKDRAELTAYDLRQSTGKFIIITNLIFNFTVIAFLSYDLFMAFKEAHQEYKAKKVKKVTPIAISVDSQFVDSSEIHTKDENQNQFSKNSREVEQSNTITDNSRSLDISGNHLLTPQPDGSIESQGPDFSSFGTPQTRNQYDLNKKVHQNFRFPQENPKILGLNSSLPQDNSLNENESQPHKTVQKRQKLQIQDGNYSLAALSQAAQRRNFRALPNIQNKELEIPQYIRGRHAFRGED